MQKAESSPKGLYTLKEIETIFAELKMKVFDSYSDFSGTPASDNHIQLMVCSQKQ